MRTRLLVTAVLAAAAAASAAGAAGPAFPNVDVSNTPGSQNEAAIAIDPTNDSILIGGSNTGAGFTMRAYTSIDGGLSWRSEAAPPVANPSNQCAVGDPGLAIDRNGKEYYSFLILEPCEAPTRLPPVHIVVASRTGPNVLWSTPTSPIASGTFADDKPSIAVDTSPASPHVNRVYVAWTRLSRERSPRLVVSHSDDGVTWSTPVDVSDRDGPNYYSTIAVGPNGEVYVAWNVDSAIYIDRSTDGGDHFGADVLVDPNPKRRSTACRAPEIDVWIPAQPNRCVRPNPILSVDLSDGPRAGRVYVSYASAGRAARQEDVFVAAFDPGLTPLFGRPLGTRARVGPPDGKRVSDQFWPASAVDRSTGRLWLCYYDTRRDPKRRQAVFTCTASSDGGVRWATPVAAASVPSSERQAGASHDIEYGDYEGLAVENGVAHPFWTDTRQLKTRLREEIYTTQIPDGALR